MKKTFTVFGEKIEFKIDGGLYFIRYADSNNWYISNKQAFERCERMAE